MSTEQPTRHLPEVIEAAEFVSRINGDSLTGTLTGPQQKAVRLLGIGCPWQYTRLAWAKMRAAEILRDALACAEAELAESKCRIADDNKAYGCELMDPCGTIWDQCAKVQKDLTAERQRREKAEERVNELRVRAVHDQNRRDLFKSSAIRLRDTRNRLLAENAKLKAEIHTVVSDRARFPDKPDGVGRILGAHVENLKSEARGNFEAWRLALARESIALRRVHDLERDLAEARKALDRVQDERAASFARIGKAAGGMSLTPYQPEADLEIEQAVKALRKDSERLDWLGENCTRAMDSERYLPRQIYWGGGSSKDIRQAIDAAREAGKGQP